MLVELGYKNQTLLLYFSNYSDAFSERNNQAQGAEKEKQRLSSSSITAGPQSRTNSLKLTVLWGNFFCS